MSMGYLSLFIEETDEYFLWTFCLFIGELVTILDVLNALATDIM